MVKATDPTPDPEPVIPDFDPLIVAAMRHGARFFGSSIVTIRVLTEDGEWRSFGLPSPAEADLTPTRRRLVAALAASPVPLTRKQLAAAVKRKPWGGRLASDIASLIESGLIFERGGLFTDDARKFPQLT